MLSRNDFAKSVISRLAQLGAKVCPRYDELSYCFFVDVSAAAATGKSGYLRLEKWYDRYQEALLDGRGDQAIDELARFWIQLVAQDASLPSLDTARMLPLVRSRFDFDVTALRAEAAGQTDVAAAIGELAWRPLGEHLAVVLAEDAPQTLRHLSLDELTSAGLTWDSALALAMHNLRGVEPAFAQPAPFLASQGNIWIPATRQSPHTSAALLWPDWCRRLPIAGQPVAFVPFATTLAITGSENYAELAHLAATTLSLMKSSSEKPLTPVPLVLDGNQWRPWQGPQGHPTYAAIRELWVAHENSLYSEQGKWLKQKYEGQDDAPYVASYKAMAVTAPSGQRSFSTVTLWTETLATLLPKTDAVILTRLLNRAQLDADENAEPQFGERITVPWDDLARQLGDKLQPQGIYPERYLVRGDAFPASQWDVLRSAQANASAVAAQVPAPSAPARGASGSPPAPIVAPPTANIAAGAPHFPGPAIPAAAPPWQPPMPASKVPLAPSRRPPIWPVVLAVAVPLALLCVVFLGVGLFIYARFSASRAEVAQPSSNQIAPPAVRSVVDQPAAYLVPEVRPAVPVMRPRQMPSYPIAPPWKETGPFPQLASPAVALPRLTIDKHDLLPSGRPLTKELDEFRDDVPDGGWLVGLRIARGFHWGGAIRAIQPIYQVDDKYVLGKLCGSSDGACQTEVLARPGYAIGKIECRAGLVNNSLRLTFFKVTDNGLDAADSYATQWLGSQGGGTVPGIGGGGEPIVALTGTYRDNDDLIELGGLVTLPLPKVDGPLPKTAGKPRDGASTGQRKGAGFADQAPDGGWLVGLRVFQGDAWGGAPLAIQPIYQVEGNYVVGNRLGRDGGEPHQWIAPPGYAVGEIWADQGLIVHRLQLRYQKVIDGTLDAGDSKDSPQLGPDGGQQFRLSSDGKPIVGLNVELGGDISSLGIIVAEK